MSRFADQSVTARSDEQDRIRRLEENVRILQTKLSNSYVLGRLRFDRTAPLSSTDVQTPDKLYDIVRDEDFEYVLINVAGDLRWRRISYVAF